MALSNTTRTVVSWLRALARHLWVYLLYTSGSLARAKSRIRLAEGALVLTLHRVLPDPECRTTLSPPGMVMTERTFASMVRYLSTEHRVFSLDAPQKSLPTDPRIAVAITFDDGWADNAKYARNILNGYSVPAAIFLCPEKMGRTLPFWPERLLAFFHVATRLLREKDFINVVGEYVHNPEQKVPVQPFELVKAVKQLSAAQRNRLFERLQQAGFREALGNSAGMDSIMSWEDARTLAEHGFLLGSHTLNHEILTKIPIGAVHDEISESRKRLSLEIGRPCLAFAYPNGDWSPEIRAVAASAGYAMAFATRPGVWTEQTDPFTIPRIGLWEGAVTGFRGRFSKRYFDYVVFWKTLRTVRQASLAERYKAENKSSLSPRAA